jgi:hypothetical protein
MEKQVAAGKSTRDMALRRYLIRVTLVVLGLGVLFYLGHLGFSTKNVLHLLLILGALVCLDRILIPVLDRLITHEGRATRGAEGEEEVGAVLDRLGTSCVVLHDLDTGRGNIDHLVFRQDGAVFLIETKSHRGTVSEEGGELRLNGGHFEKDLLKQTHGNVFWLRNFLEPRLSLQPWITAAMVFPSAFVTVRRTLRGVDVINAGFLEKWMARARGNPQVAKKLWPQIGQLKREIRQERAQRGRAATNC